MYRDALTKQFGDVAGADQMGLTRLGVELQNRGVNLDALDQQLWADNKPYLYWLICAAIGITSVILLAIYRRAVPNLEETKRT